MNAFSPPRHQTQRIELDLTPAQVNQLREVVDNLPLSRYASLIVAVLPKLTLSDAADSLGGDAPVTINFVGVGDDEIVRNAVKSLDAEEQKLRSELHNKLVDIQERKSQLLALTYEPEEEEEQERDEPPDPDGECFRGGEYAASVAAEQAHIQRTLK